VPNVIDSLIGTILSQNTNSRNSTSAKHSLDEAFGRNNFGAIDSAPRSEVVEALRHGGLANRKAAIIQNLLKDIKARHGVYSLQHLAAPGVTDEEVMAELVSYDGVGPKTAACVLAFCLNRDAFAVDTHVFRLSKLLGWVPNRSTGVDRVRAQAHLELRIPPEIKHALHCLMVHHGRACSECGPQGRSTKNSCVLRKYLRTKQGVKEEELCDRVEEASKQEHGVDGFSTKLGDTEMKLEVKEEDGLEATEIKQAKRTRRKRY
jgi:endonuclease-3